MQYCNKRKESTQHCYNNQYLVVSLHRSFGLAIRASKRGDSVSEVTDTTKRGDIVDSNGKK